MFLYDMYASCPSSRTARSDDTPASRWLALVSFLLGKSVITMARFLLRAATLLACATAAHAFQHASTRAWCVQKPGGVISRWASGSKLGSTMRYPRVTSLAASAEDVEETQMLAEEKMSKSLENLQGNLASLRTGRASPDILSRVTIDYYGAPTPLMQLASVSVTSSSQLLVDPYDKSAIADIERGIMDSNVGLTPNSDGEIIRLSVPQLTGDTRKTLAKEAKAIGEECKIAVRNIRRDAIETVKKFEKNKEIGEDVSKDGQDAVQKLTDSFVKKIDTAVAAKEKDILTV